MEGSSINTQCTAIIIIRLLPSTTNFPEAKLSSTFLSPIFWNYSKTFQQQPENIQRLFRLQICLSRNYQLYSGNIQRLSGQQSPPSTSSNQQQQPAAATAAINSSNQQQQQQQSTAAINSSNQQHQPAAAFDNNNQLQQEPAFVLPASLPQSTTTHAVDVDVDVE